MVDTWRYDIGGQMADTWRNDVVMWADGRHIEEQHSQVDRW